MAAPPIPNVQAPVVGAGGLLTPQWHSFFLRLRDAAGGDTALQAALDKVIERLDELEASGGAGAVTFDLQGLGSVVVNGTPAGGTVQVTLDNDSDAPGNTWHYGTGPDGARGWFAAADALEVTADLTKVVDVTGVATVGLAEPPLKEAPEDGKKYARKDGDWSAIAAAPSLQFPLYDTSGAFAPVPLTADNQLPFYLADGTQSNIPMVTA